MIRLVFTVVALSGIAGCAGSGSIRTAEPAPIKIESVRITAAGHYLDLRYRVLDPVRANEMLGPGIKPLLIDQASGIKMAVPMTAKLGALRQTRGIQRPNHLYFVIFVNSAGLHPGSQVTAQLGDMAVSDLTVE